MNENQANVCYQCGSDQGTAVRLCPTCTQQRLAKKKDMESYSGHSQERQSSYSSASAFGNPMVTAGIIAVIVGIAGYFLLFSVYGPGWGLSKADYIYKKCLQKFSSVGGSDLAAAGGDKFSAEFGKSFLDAMSVGVCEQIRNECSKPEMDSKCMQLLNS